LKYAKHYHNLDKLQPVLSKMENKKPVFVSYLGNSNCSLVKEDGYERIWPEILTAELNCFFQSQYTFGTVMGLAGQSWAKVLKERATVLDHLPADLMVVYCGMRINFAKKYEAYLSDLEEILNVCSEKATVLTVTSIPMLTLDSENHRLKNEIWETPEHLQKHTATRELLIDKLKLPCVDLYNIWKEMHESDEIESTDFFERSDSAHPAVLGQFMVARTIRKAFAPRCESVWGY